MNLHLESLDAPEVQTQPGEQYQSLNRHWQGVPGIERAPGGRFFAAWYSGGEGEGPLNYILLVQSDDGEHWQRPLVVIDPPGKVRAFDPVLWIDPLGRLWLFWSQCHTLYDGRGGVWFIRCDAPDVEGELAWSVPRRIANGIMMNKPLACGNGDWLFPTAIWGEREPRLPELAGEARSNVVVSDDQGESFTLRGGAEVPFRTADEHMVVERRDGTLWMLVRTRYGIGQSVSADGGATWSPGWPTAIAGPNSRFYIRRLASGRLLLINHDRGMGRSHLTASLSEDDGTTWFAHLLLDERPNVSYPDATVSADGVIYVIYDRERVRECEILMAAVTEEEILRGSANHRGSFFKRVIDKAGKPIS